MLTYRAVPFVFAVALVACGGQSINNSDTKIDDENDTLQRRSLTEQTWLSNCVEISGVYFLFSISFGRDDNVYIQKMPQVNSDCSDWDGHGDVYFGTFNYGDSVLSSEGIQVDELDIELSGIGTIKTLIKFSDNQFYLGSAFYDLILTTDRYLEVDYDHYFTFRAD